VLVQTARTFEAEVHQGLQTWATDGILPSRSEQGAAWPRVKVVAAADEHRHARPDDYTFDRREVRFEPREVSRRTPGRALVQEFGC